MHSTGSRGAGRPFVARAALVMLWLVLLAISAAAQTGPRHYPGFQGFDPESDTTFPLGVHGAMARIGYLKDSLHIDYIQCYGQACSLHHLEDSTGPEWNPTGVSSTVKVDLLTQLRRDRAFYAAAFKDTMKVVTSPCTVADLVDDCLGIENYYGWNKDTVTAVGFTDPGYIAPGGVWSKPPGGDFDTVPNRQFFGATFPQRGTGYDTLIAGGSKQTATGLHTVQNWYARIGRPDSTAFFDVMLTLKAGSSITDPGVPDTAVVAYALLYRRDSSGQWRNDPAGQRDCGCNFYYPMATYEITKSLYLNDDSSRFDPNSGYRDFTYTFRFSDPPIPVASPVVVPRWGAPSTKDTVFRAGDTARRYVPVGSLRPNGAASNTGNECGWYCSHLLDSLKARGILPSTSINRTGMVEGSDFYVDVRTTSRVPITFLKTTVSNHLLSLVRDTALDGLVRLSIDSIYADDTVGMHREMALKPILWRYGIRDEPFLGRYLGLRHMTSKVQRAVLARDTNDKRGIFSNPMGENSSFRVYLGDLDSTGVKQVHMVANQLYNFGGPIPITYADIDSMSSAANRDYYRLIELDQVVSSDTVRGRFQMGNSAPDYNYYTRSSQNSIKLKIEQTAEALDVARSRFQHLNAAPYPVYFVSQVHGAVEGTGWKSGWRPTTPEEITVQPWIALSCGVDGMLFSDFQYSGEEFGIMHSNQDTAFANPFDNRNYDSLLSGDPRDTIRHNPGLPKMWTGFKDRSAAVRRVTNMLHDTILPVYNRLKRSPARLSVNDTARKFASIPLVDSLYAERAVQYTSTITPSNTFDARSQTYMDLAVFEPGKYMPTEQAEGARYLMVVNRRCWPIDFRTYSESSRRTLDSFARWDSLTGQLHSRNGLGNVDVRRPVVLLKQGAGVIADSFRVTKVGTPSWDTVVAARTALKLQWLTPGWGAMYKVTPVRSGVSPLASGYNNAVRSVNLSDAARKGQVVAYERDSVVYAMTMDSSGNWSREFRISDVGDVSTSSRAGHNMFPSVSTVRNGTAWLFVWERYDVSTGKSSVEARYWPRFPHPDSLTMSRKLSAIAPARTISGSYRMTPSVVGVDSGFVVSWATPSAGIEAVAIPDVSNLKSAFISSPVQLKGIQNGNLYFLDSLCQYPTLAYVRNYDNLGHVVHCAWQQHYSVGEDIYYQRVRVRFPSGTQAVLAKIGLPERVTTNMPGCHFLHPSIAADSIRVGVAFQALLPYYRGKTTKALAGGISVICLKFRDTTALKSGWNTPGYYWGDDSSYFERPSVTEFPMAPKSLISGVNGKPEGALAWFRSKGSTSDPASDQIYLYRFGKTITSRAAQGRHPSMTLVPFRGSTPFMDRSSLFYRDAEARSFLHKFYYTTGNGRYMDGLLLNHPSKPDTNFTTTSGSSLRVFMSKSLRFTLIGRFASVGACGLPTFTGALQPIASASPSAMHPDTGRTEHPDVPPSFFAHPDGGGTLIETLEDGARISRTSVFLSKPAPVAIRRLVAGSDFLVDWLDSQPYDSSAGAPANLRSYLELVRNSDGVVLWRGDTVTARTVGSSSFDDVVEVPTHTAAPLGTAVYIRLRIQPTAGIVDTSYDVSAGFYNEMDSTEPGFLKMVRRAAPATSSRQQAGLTVEIIPNPAQSTAVIRVTAVEAGTLELGIYDMLGNLVRSMPSAAVGLPGEYAATIDVSGLTAGPYAVRARMGTEQTTGQLTVAR